MEHVPTIYINKSPDTAFTNSDSLAIAKRSRIIYVSIDKDSSFAFFVFAIKADIRIEQALRGLAKSIDAYTPDNDTFARHGKNVSSAIKHCILTSAIQPVLIDDKPYFVLSSYSYY